jgi:uncharacterized protein YodC (DUF2158 family)
MIERMTYGDDGTLDEVVVTGGANLEHLDENRWFLSMLRADGSEFCLWFDGKITMTEERSPAALAAYESTSKDRIERLEAALENIANSKTMVVTVADARAVARAVLKGETD